MEEGYAIAKPVALDCVRLSRSLILGWDAALDLFLLLSSHPSLRRDRLVLLATRQTEQHRALQRDVVTAALHALLLGLERAQVEHAVGQS